MANKYHRKNLNKGGRSFYKNGSESELQKKVDRDALVFGAKKAIERAKNKKNKTLKRVLDIRTNKPIFATDSEIMNNPDRYKPVKGNIINMLKTSDREKANKRVMDYLKSVEPGGRFSEKDIEMAKKVLNMKKGGRVDLKRGTKPKNITDLMRARLGQFTLAGRLSKPKKKFGGRKK
jgi:hypothetical protein